MAAPRPQSSLDVHGERRDAVSNKCGITLNDSVQSREIVKVMEKKPGVTITYYPSMIRIDGENNDCITAAVEAAGSSRSSSHAELSVIAAPKPVTC